MSVLITAEVRGQTAQGYDDMLAELAASLEQAPGLILHSSHATEDGWRVIEVWQSKAQSDQFFATVVAPRLPPGIRPKRSVQALHNVALPALGVCAAEIEARAEASRRAAQGAREARGGATQRACNAARHGESPRPFGLDLLRGACGVASLARASSPGGATRLACAPNQVQRGPRFLPRRLLAKAGSDSGSVA